MQVHVLTEGRHISVSTLGVFLDGDEALRCLEARRMALSETAQERAVHDTEDPIKGFVSRVYVFVDPEALETDDNDIFTLTLEFNIEAH